MKKIIVILIIFLIAAELLAWRIYQATQEQPTISVDETESKEESKVFSESSKEDAPMSSERTSSVSETNTIESENFPAPFVEEKNGRMERTIHMGVRQYAWDPSVLTVKKGELVRLIIHNADVMHGLVIPELNVLNIDIPPEGAVIEFTPNKTGAFEFFCSYYCGEGHMEMRGKIIVQ